MSTAAAEDGMREAPAFGLRRVQRGDTVLLQQVQAIEKRLFKKAVSWKGAWRPRYLGILKSR